MTARNSDTPKRAVDKARDPAAYRARQAINTANYRARQVALKAGVDIPAAIAAKREARYRPARVTPHVQKVRAEQARQSSVQKAVDKGAAERAARTEFVSRLPQARNPSENIEPPNYKARAPGRNADARMIRQGHAATKLAPHGKRLKADFREGTFSGLTENMNRDEREEFGALSRRASKVTGQALAIYFQFEGGSGEFGSIVTQLRYGGAGGHDEALGRMRNLVKRLETAERLYGRSAIGPAPRI